MIKYKVQMHWSLWGVSHLGLAKLVNCNQILGHVADQDYIDEKCYWQICINHDNRCPHFLKLLDKSNLDLKWVNRTQSDSLLQELHVIFGAEFLPPANEVAGSLCFYRCLFVVLFRGSPCDHYPWCIGPHCTGHPHWKPEFILPNHGRPGHQTWSSQKTYSKLFIWGPPPQSDI